MERLVGGDVKDAVSGSEGFPRCRYASLREGAFAGALRAAGFSCRRIRTRVVAFKRERGWLASREVVARQLRDMPKSVGIFCANDTWGREIIWMAWQSGLRVPDDVSVVGVDNDEFICKSCQPPLSSIDIGAPRIGYEAAGLLHRMIEGQSPPKQPLLLPPVRVVTRQSSDVLAVQDADVAEVLRFLRDHIHQPVRVKDVLAAVPVSRRALEGKFAALLGRTPAAEIVRLRVERAQRLLAETDLPMSEVARQCGFVGAPIFSVVFRRETGYTPSAYRRGLG